jgi:ABC-type Fe3+-hydroxamate transport system substrate-binding protein
MKKFFFFALLSAFTLAATSCNKDDATETVDKTEYTVNIFVAELSYNASKGTYSYDPLEGVTITLLDYGKTCTTGKDGKATLTLPLGNYRVTVTKDNYDYSTPSTYPTTFGKEKYLMLDVEGNDVWTIVLNEKD